MLFVVRATQLKLNNHFKKFLIIYVRFSHYCYHTLEDSVLKQRGPAHYRWGYTMSLKETQYRGMGWSFLGATSLKGGKRNVPQPKNINFG